MRPARLPLGRFTLGLAAWLLAATPFWALLTPAYNRFLTATTEALLHLGEIPNVTQLVRADRHHVVVVRTDFSPARAEVRSIRVTDLHFHLLLLAALFLAVPGVPWRRRVRNLGLATLVTIGYDLLLFFFWVKFVYATQLGAWSLEHYGPLARNFWGLGKHLLDLPFKFALPFLLWAAVYLPLLLGGGEVTKADRARR